MNKVFVIDVINLLGLDDLTFVKKFEGDVLAGFFVLGHFDFTESTLSEDSADLVVFQLEFFYGLAFSFLHGICLKTIIIKSKITFFFYIFFSFLFQARKNFLNQFPTSSFPIFRIKSRGIFLSLHNYSK